MNALEGAIPIEPSAFFACHHLPCLSMISRTSPFENEISFGSSGDAASRGGARSSLASSSLLELGREQLKHGPLTSVQRLRARWHRVTRTSSAFCDVWCATQPSQRAPCCRAHRGAARVLRLDASSADGRRALYGLGHAHAHRHRGAHWRAAHANARGRLGAAQTVLADDGTAEAAASASAAANTNVSVGDAAAAVSGAYGARTDVAVRTRAVVADAARGTTTRATTTRGHASAHRVKYVQDERAVLRGEVEHPYDLQLECAQGHDALSVGRRRQTRANHERKKMARQRAGVTHVDHRKDEPAGAHGVERADVGEDALVDTEDGEYDADGAEHRELEKITSVSQYSDPCARQEENPERAGRGCGPSSAAQRDSRVRSWAANVPGICAWPRSLWQVYIQRPL